MSETRQATADRPSRAAELQDVLGQFGTARIAVVGDVCLDAYWHLDPDTDERSLETGLPVRRVTQQRYSLGGAGNVVANLVALGVGQIRAIGVVGADPFGVAVRRLLGQLPVDLSGLLTVGDDWQTLTYAKPHIGALEQERLDFGSRAPLPDVARAALLRSVSDSAEWADVVVLNQQTQGCFADPRLIAEINRIVGGREACRLLVDARDAAASCDSAIVKVNVREAAGLLGESNGEMARARSVVEMARRIMGRTGHPVFITRGERGIVAVDQSGEFEALGVQVLGAVDPVGAGDTVTATIAATIASGGGTGSAAVLANLAASITVGKTHTTGSATADEIRRLMDDCDYVYGADLADAPAPAGVTGIGYESIEALPDDLRVEHVIFDHDGTLSTLRQGWEQVMKPMMVDAIVGREVSPAERPGFADIEVAVSRLIERTTGIQTLVQMDALVQLVRESGFVPAARVKDAQGYKHDYNRRLMDLVDGRRRRLESGELEAEDFLIKGSHRLLAALSDRGVRLYLVSGTDEQDVRSESALLGIAGYFGDHIYGAVGDIRTEMKKVVMERVVREGDLRGSTLVAFGDGPVEMRETRKRGGVAIGVCSDEVRRYGFNHAKRSRLIRGGATLLIPDYGALPSLMGMLFPDGRARGDGS